MKQAEITIYSDGGSRGNPGKAAYGFIILDNNKKLIYKEGNRIGIATNNIAEYMGVVKSLEWVSNNLEDISTINIILDSELVARQMSGIYKIKNEQLKTHAEKIKNLEKIIGANFIYKSVPRSENKEADKLVNIALDSLD